MSRRVLRRWVRAGVAALAVLAVTVACAGLPTTGAVNPGRPAGEDAGGPAIAFVPDPPPPGASPEQIVEGFIAAASSPRDYWFTARQYLAESVRESWDPLAGVIIDLPAGRAPVSSADGGAAVTLTVTPEARLSASGMYSVADGGQIRLDFRLAPQADGEWRIVEAPDGIVLDQSRFEAVFRSYALMFFDPTYSFVVPDLRWFPVSNAPTWIARALVNGGPSPWLTGAVATAFPEDVLLDSLSAVPLQSGVAQVTLSAEAVRLDAEVLDRMQTQLDLTLQQAGATRADMLVDGQALVADDITTRPTRVERTPLVLADGRFGFYSDGVTEIPGLSDIVEGLEPVAFQLDAEHTTAAVLSASAGVVRAVRDSSPAVVDPRPDLIEPSIDPDGFIWTVPRDVPAAVLATAADGTTYSVADAWPGAAEILGMQVSRDGTRAAALVREGAGWAVWASGIVRDSEQAPTALTDPILLGSVTGTGVDLAWIGQNAVTVVSVDDGRDRSLHQPIGGFGTESAAPPGVRAVAGGNPNSGVHALDAEGVLYVQRGTAWQEVTSGVAVLGTQTGVPR